MTTVCPATSQAFRIGLCYHRPASVPLRFASLLSRTTLLTAREGGFAISATSPIFSKPQLPLHFRYAVPSHIATRPFSKQSVLAAQPVEHPVPNEQEDVGVEKRNDTENPSPLTQAELNEIFGQDVDREGAAELLSRLQRQRREGTLDEGLPYPEQLIERGLEYLRSHYPIDEDGAIIARLDMELDGHWSLPQMYPEKSPTGRSVLDEIRKTNKAKRDKEDAKMEAELAELKLRRLIRQRQEAEKADRKATALQIADNRRPRHLALPRKDGTMRSIQGPTENSSGGNLVAFSEAQERRMKRLDGWIRSSNERVAQLRANATLQKLPQMTRWQRLWRSGLFTFAIVGFGLAIAQFYTPPSPNARLFPDVSPAAAAVGTIIAINAVLFVMWRVPHAWKAMNSYFMVVPAVPRAFSMLGAEFSHQKWPHFTANMLAMWFLGKQLHDDVGRGPFLGIILCGAVIPSFCSLVPHVLMRILITASVGASGIITTLIGTSCVLHEGRKITILGLPPEMTSWINTGVLLPFFVLIEVVNLSHVGLMSKALIQSGRPPIDHLGHLAGYATGAIAGYLMRQKDPYWGSIPRESFWSRRGPRIEEPNAKDPAVDESRAGKLKIQDPKIGLRKVTPSPDILTKTDET